MRNLAIVAVLCVCSSVQADPPHRHGGRSYPLVYGATGRPYGPTQAEYQYQRRYGHPSGYGSHYYFGSGSNFSASLSLHPYFYSGYSSIYGPGVPIYTAPNVYSGPAPIYGGSYGTYSFIPQSPIENPVPYQVQTPGQPYIPQENILPLDNNLNSPIEPQPIFEESTPQQQEIALRERVRGDEDFAKTDYRNAGDHYYQATRVAPDQADPRYRFALTLAARGRFDEAVEHLKIAAELDVNWPRTSGVTLDGLYQVAGPDDWPKRDEKNRVKTRIAEWTNRDVRDPNRLFLLAAVMMLDGDVRAKSLLDTAIRLNGVQNHLLAFYTPMSDEVEPQQQDNLSAPIEPVRPKVIDPLNQDTLIPPPPAPNRGEVTGEERENRVFERSRDFEKSLEFIPPVPGDSFDLDSEPTLLEPAGTNNRPVLPPPQPSP